jgi:hypothetical protein
VGIAAVEGRTIVSVEWQATPKSFGQIRIGDEVATEGHEVGITGRHNGRSRFTREAAGGNQRAAELRPQMLGRNGGLAFGDLFECL